MLDYFFLKKDFKTRTLKWILLVGHAINLVLTLVIVVMALQSNETIFGLAGLSIEKAGDGQIHDKVTEIIGKFIYEDMSMLAMFELAMFFAVLLDAGFMALIIVTAYTLPVTRYSLNLGFSQLSALPLLIFFGSKMFLLGFTMLYTYMVWKIGPVNVKSYARLEHEERLRSRKRAFGVSRKSTEVDRTDIDKVSLNSEKPNDDTNQLTSNSTEKSKQLGSKKKDSEEEKDQTKAPVQATASVENQ